MADNTQQTLKTIFPDSSFAKRMAVKALRLYAKTIPAPPPFPPPGDAPVKILIQSMGGIGNTLMATPLIAATRKLYPNATIDVLTTPGAAQLLKTDPNASNVYADQDGSDFSRRHYREINGDIRRRNYEAALLTLNAVTFRFAARSVFTRIPVRVIHRYSFRAYDNFLPAFTHVFERDLSRHDTENNVALLENLTGTKTGTGPLVLILTDEEKNAAQQALDAAGLDLSKPVVMLCPGSSGWMSFKRWPLEKYIELTQEILANRTDSQVLLSLGPDERHELPKWKESIANNRFYICPDLKLREFAAAIEIADLVITNDSLPMHIRSAFQRPLIALFGPTNPAHTGPWSDHANVICPPDVNHFFFIPYSPDPTQFPNQMEEIDVSEILGIVEAELNNTNTEFGQIIDH